MNKYERKNRPNTYELVVPFGAEDGLEPLYDDCPICQELKRDLEVRKANRLSTTTPLVLSGLGSSA